MAQLFLLLSQKKFAAARLAYQQLDVTDPRSGTRFFEAYGVGKIQDSIERPLERYVAYETLLDMAKEDDPEKYKKLHKGNPFYFLGWTAFEIKDYERAVFYMDAAVSEDRRNFKTEWQTFPAARFLLLDEKKDHAAWEITLRLRRLIEEEINRFSGLLPPDKAFNWDSFDRGFIQPLVEETSCRSILTAFYSFILEAEDRRHMLELRSVEEGSIEPFLVHLFKGGLIFESLLKKAFNIQKKRATFKDIFIDSSVQNLFGGWNSEMGADSFGEVFIKLKKTESDLAKKAFIITGKIRNTAGHNLEWPNEFTNPQEYTQLCEQVINALLFIVARKPLS